MKLLQVPEPAAQEHLPKSRDLVAEFRASLFSSTQRPGDNATLPKRPEGAAETEMNYSGLACEPDEVKKGGI